MEVVHYQGTGSANGRLIVFLHGFPSVRSKQNREIAAAVSKETGRPTELLLYSGLGHASGKFTFSGCLAEVSGYFENLFNGPVKHVDLVGHSWGGYLALTMASRYPDRVRKLVLMSPLLWFASEERVVGGFAESREENPQIDFGDLDSLARDFCRIGRAHPSETLIAGVSPATEVLFLQARIDPITPADIAITKKGLFQHPPVFELTNNDHSFLSDRPELSSRIARFLGQ